LNEHAGLVVGEGREGLGFLGGNGGVALNERSHDATSGLDTDGQWGDIQKQDLAGGLGRGVTGQDSSLDGSSVGNGLVRVDGFVGLLAVEEVGDEFLDARDTGGTTDQDDLVDRGLVDLCVSEDTLNWLHSGAEEILAKLFETSTSDGCVEINTLIERVDLDGGLSGGGQSALGTFAGSSETSESTSVGREVYRVRVSIWTLPFCCDDPWWFGAV